MLGPKFRTLFFSLPLIFPKSSPSNFWIRMSSSSSSSSAPSPIIEHVVLFKIKNEAEPSKVADGLSGINSLSFLDEVLHLSAGPIHRNLSSAPFKFTHMLHSRYRSKEALSGYSGHPSHLRVVTELGSPICEDVTAVDWVANDISGPVVLRPGSAMRVTLMKLKEGVKDEKKVKVLGTVGEMKDRLRWLDQMSYGENFSPARAKGFSIASLAIFRELNGLEALDSNPGMWPWPEDKVTDLLDQVIVLDYVVPPQQSASL